MFRPVLKLINKGRQSINWKKHHVSVLWKCAKRNASLLSVIISSGVLVAMTCTLLRQSDFNEFQKKVIKAGLDPSIDVELIPLKEGTSVSSYILPDSTEIGAFELSYKVTNLGSRNLYKVITSSIVSGQKSIEPKRSLLEKSDAPTSDLPPGASIRRDPRIDVPFDIARHGGQFWFIIRLDFQNTVEDEFVYFKSFPFLILDVKVREIAPQGDSAFTFKVTAKKDMQADWSRLFPSDSLK